MEELEKKFLNNLIYDQDVFCFEFNLELLKDISQKRENRYSEPVKVSKVLRDFAFIFDKSLTYR